jgi:hypothetical protein
MARGALAVADSVIVHAHAALLLQHAQARGMHA